MSRARALRRPERRKRVLVTPEGLSLPLTIASRGARASALMLDLIIMGAIQIAVTLALVGILFGLLGEKQSAAMEFLGVVWIIAMFLFRYGYFLYFELGPRGATPGKRLTGIRIAARDGGRLSVNAVIARNLLRDIEIFLPLIYLLSSAGEGGAANWASFAWLAIFLLFPFFNRDAMRAGDLIAGTWVVEVPRRKLEQAMSLGEAARGRSVATGAQYRFGEAELSVYGEYELQTLERVLRENNPEALVAVATAICNKIGWSAGSGDERAFLEAFYAQLRARLERGMRLGNRKADKFSIAIPGRPSPCAPRAKRIFPPLPRWAATASSPSSAISIRRKISTASLAKPSATKPLRASWPIRAGFIAWQWTMLARLPAIARSPSRAPFPNMRGASGRWS